MTITGKVQKFAMRDKMIEELDLNQAKTAKVGSLDRILILGMRARLDNAFRMATLVIYRRF